MAIGSQLLNNVGYASSGHSRSWDGEPSRLEREIVDHYLYGCDEHHLQSCRDFRTYSIIIGCQCGRRWMLSDFLLRDNTPEAKRLAGLAYLVEVGEFVPDSRIMKSALNKKIRDLKDKIQKRMNRMQELKDEVKKTEIEEKKKVLNHPILGLQL